MIFKLLIFMRKSKDRKEELLEEIKYSDGSGLYTKLGMVAGSICKKEGIYYCPCCAKKDIDDYGEAYIHREHQLQGIFICPHDGAELKKYSVDKTNSSRIEFIRLDKKLLDLRGIRAIDDNNYDKLYKISRDAYYLLQADLADVDKDMILEKYKNMLYEKGLTTTSKRVKQREVYEEFIGFYGEEFLEYMESSIDNDDEYNWLRVITRDLSRTEIRELCKKEYTYLYRQDKEWLYSNLPEKTVKINESRVVDWDVRDDEILKKVKNAYIELLNNDNPIRISKSSIGKVSGVIAALEKNLDKLPRTKAYLDKVVETTEAFQVRRCKNIIDEKTKNDEEIKLWEVKRAAGIRDSAFEKIKGKILDYIDKKERWGSYGKGIY